MKYINPISGILACAVVMSSCNKYSDEVYANTSSSIISISPVSGPFDTIDTIKGTNFSAKDSVRFNGMAATVMMVKSDTLIVKVPQHAGTGPVTIIHGRDTVAGPVFTYL